MLIEALKNFLGWQEAPTPVDDFCLVSEVEGEIKESKLPELRELTEKINNGG